MLKGKEVISDPQAQYDIAKQIHEESHAGINKTTAVIATKFHWVRIKETVSHVIKNCPECKDTNKPPILRGDGTRSTRSKTIEGQDKPPELSSLTPTPVKSEGQGNEGSHSDSNGAAHVDLNHVQNGHDLRKPVDLSPHLMPTMNNTLPDNMQADQMSMNLAHQDMPLDDTIDDGINDNLDEHISADDYRAIQQQMGLHQGHDLTHELQTTDAEMLNYDDMAIDPQIMEQLQRQIAAQEFADHDAAFQMPPPQHHNMQHFENNQRPQLQSHQDIRSDPGPHPQYADPKQMQQHSNHDPSNYSQHHSPNTYSQPGSQYISPIQQPHNMMSQPVPDDHIMSGHLDGDGGGINNMQQIRHVLSMDYMNAAPDGSHPFGQPRQ